MIRGLVLLGFTACLGPQVSDEVDPARVLGDVALEPVELPHVEDNPALAANVAQFPDEVPYLQGYASGQVIWYWRVPPPVTDFIVPFYVVVGRDGAPLQPPIIDVLPGDPGYSPWWRVVTVRASERYGGERFYSREAIDLGVELGLLEPPVITEVVATCPVVHSSTRIQVDASGTRLEPAFAIYRDQRVSWLRFDSDITVPAESRQMPLSLFYVLQRINQPYPLAELDAGFDLNGDGLLNASNTIFQFHITEPGYTPFWYPVHVRTVPDLVSIDTASTAEDVELTHEDDFVGPVYLTVISDRVIPPLVDRPEAFENCPIQRTPGGL